VSAARWARRRPARPGAASRPARRCGARARSGPAPRGCGCAPAGRCGRWPRRAAPRARPARRGRQAAPRSRPRPAGSRRRRGRGPAPSRSSGSTPSLAASAETTAGDGTRRPASTRDRYDAVAAGERRLAQRHAPLDAGLSDAGAERPGIGDVGRRLASHVFGWYRRLPGGKSPLTGNHFLPNVVFWQCRGGGELCVASCAPRSLWQWRSPCPRSWVRAPVGGPEARGLWPRPSPSLSAPAAGRRPSLVARLLTDRPRCALLSPSPPTSPSQVAVSDERSAP